MSRLQSCVASRSYTWTVGRVAWFPMPPAFAPCSIFGRGSVSSETVCLLTASSITSGGRMTPPSHPRSHSASVVNAPRTSLRSTPTSRGPVPNHALQRTEAGVYVFSVYPASSRQPPSLSLDSLGPSNFLPWGSLMASLFPFLRSRAGSRSFFGSSVVRASVFLRSPFPGGSARLSPAGGPSPVRALQRTLCRRGPNHALQRTGTGGRLFCVLPPLASPVPVAELESVRPLASRPLRTRWACHVPAPVRRAPAVPRGSVAGSCYPPAGAAVPLGASRPRRP